MFATSAMAQTLGGGAPGAGGPMDMLVQFAPLALAASAVVLEFRLPTLQQVLVFCLFLCQTFALARIRTGVAKTASVFHGIDPLVLSVFGRDSVILVICLH